MATKGHKETRQIHNLVTKAAKLILRIECMVHDLIINLGKFVPGYRLAPNGGGYGHEVLSQKYGVKKLRDK